MASGFLAARLDANAASGSLQKEGEPKRLHLKRSGNGRCPGRTVAREECLPGTSQGRFCSTASRPIRGLRASAADDAHGDLPEAWGMNRCPGTKPGCPGSKDPSVCGVERQVPTAEALGGAASRRCPRGHGLHGHDLAPKALQPARRDQVGRRAGDIGRGPEPSGIRTTIGPRTARIPPYSSL